jgi:hypothetical protein
MMPLSPPCCPCHRHQAAVALVWGLVVDDDNNDDNDAAFVPPCHHPHHCQATPALVRGLVVALAWSLAQALAGGVFVIVLALAQNLFNDYDDNDDDGDAFISPCRPCHHRQAATTLVWGLVVALAWLLAWAFARGVVVIVLALEPNLFNDDDDDDNKDAFVSPLPPPPSLQKRWSLSTGE